MTNTTPFNGILDLSQTYTDRQVYDAALSFMKTQGRLSTVPSNPQTSNPQILASSTYGVYRHPSGSKCVVGAFISDADYDPEFETMDVPMLINWLETNTINSTLERFLLSHTRVLGEMQEVHDMASTYTEFMEDLVDPKRFVFDEDGNYITKPRYT